MCVLCVCVFSPLSLSPQVVRRCEARVAAMVEERVAAYVATPEFAAMMEEVKRRRREEMLAK